MRWWRRNRWGLILLLPLAVGVVAINSGLFYRAYVSRAPTEQIVAAPGTAVEFGDARLRLVEVTQPGNDPDLVGDDRTLPAGLRIWRTVFEVDAPEKSLTTSSCSLYLVDEQGRRYGPSPSELHGIEALRANCLSIDREFDLEKGFEPFTRPFRATAYFVMPSDAHPTGVRLTHTLELPRYVFFSVP